MSHSFSILCVCMCCHVIELLTTFTDCINTIRKPHNIHLDGGRTLHIRICDKHQKR